MVKQPVVLSNVITEFTRATVNVLASPIGKGTILAIVIQNPLNNADGTGNNTDIMVGRGAGQPYQMLPGQESPMIYADDLEQIYTRVRSVAGVAVTAATVEVTVIIYREK